MSSELENECGTNRYVEGNENIEGLEGAGNCQISSENEPSEEYLLSEQVFSIPITMKQILQHLDKKDLLQTSLVNKNWNFFSREILREKENCLAIVAGTNFCHELKKLHDLLLNSKTVPFNGISLVVPRREGSGHECVIRQEDLFDLVLNNIMKQINIKYFDMNFGYFFNSTCIASECIREILVDKASSLEGLSIDQAPDLSKTISEFLGGTLNGHWLPNVKILEFTNPCGPHQELVKELLEASPKLEKICGIMDTQCLEFILPLKAARAVNNFYFKTQVNSLVNCASFALENPKLEKLRFSTALSYGQSTKFSDWSEFHQNEACRILKQLLKSSQDSLEQFTCDHRDLILLIFQWNIQIFKEVKCLKLFHDNYLDAAEDYRTLRKIEWTKYFPRLREVYLSEAFSEQVDRDFYIGDAFRELNAEFVCESVEIFRWRWSNTALLEFFQHIFPNVKEFNLQWCEEVEFPDVLTELLNGNWSELELIRVVIYFEQEEESYPNFDSVFLGISEEEAAYLLENVEDLESLEIVSTSPCILHLRKLKKLEIHAQHRPELCSQTSSTSDSQSVFVSRLTRLCGFSRASWMAVEVHTDLCEYKQNCKFALNHLEKFVKRLN